MEEMILKFLKSGAGFGDLIKVAEHTKRKFALLKEKDSSLDEEEYLPMLFESELADFLMRREINRRGESICVLSA